MISDLLQEEIKAQIPDKEVAILLSGGVDSLSLAFACHRLGKKINAYNFHLDGKQKSHVRTAYKEEFEKIGVVKNHLNLQLESGVDTLFEELLKNKTINYKNRIRVMDICKDWSLHD